MIKTIRSDINNNNTGYLFSVGPKDFERISILNGLYNDGSLKFLQLKKSMNVFTFGCGPGLLENKIAELIQKGKILATDSKQEQLKIAEEINVWVSNIEFKKLDITKTDKIEVKKYDRIHCRFVLSHLPWEKIEKILSELWSQLSEKGALVLEEITGLDSLTCGETTHKGYEAWKNVFYKQFETQNFDPNPGERIYKYFQNQENCNIIHETYQPILKTAKEKSILRLGMESLKQSFLDKKIYKEEEIKEIIEDLRKLEEEEENLLEPRYVSVTQGNCMKILFTI